MTVWAHASTAEFRKAGHLLILSSPPVHSVCIIRDTVFCIKLDGGNNLSPKKRSGKVLRNPRPIPSKEKVHFTLFDLNLGTRGYNTEASLL